MKQQITIAQWHELSLKAKGTWNDENSKKGREVTFGFIDEEPVARNLPNIGQMIEFLSAGMPVMLGKHSNWHGGKWFFSGGQIIGEIEELTETALNSALKRYTADELCDVLWEATKEVLEK